MARRRDALLTMVLGAFSVLGLKLWYEPSDGLTATERVLVLDADTLKPIQGIPVRFSRHDWKLRALGGSHSFLGSDHGGATADQCRGRSNIHVEWENRQRVYRPSRLTFAVRPGTAKSERATSQPSGSNLPYSEALISKSALTIPRRHENRLAATRPSSWDCFTLAAASTGSSSRRKSASCRTWCGISGRMRKRSLGRKFAMSRLS